MWAFPGLLAFDRRRPRRPPPASSRATTRPSSGASSARGPGSSCCWGSSRRRASPPCTRRWPARRGGARSRMAAWIRANLPPGRRHRERRDQRRVPDRAPQPEPARGDEPGLRRQPDRRARGRRLRVARAPAPERAARASCCSPAPATRGPSSCAPSPTVPRSSRPRASATTCSSSARAGTSSTAAREPVLARGASARSARLQEVDRLDVCDARDEAAHGYRYESRLGELLLAGSVGHRPRAPADGRDDARRRRPARSSGGESFRVRTHGGRELVVVLRSRTPVVASAMRAQGSLSAPVEVPEMGILAARGRQGGGAPRAAQPAGLERARLPRARRRPSPTGSTELELSGRYAAFHYWFYQ